MAWRNIQRNLRRTLITLSAITFGLSAMIMYFGFTDGFHDQWVENTVRAYTGHIQIFRSGYRDDPQLYRAIKEVSEVMAEIKREPAVETYTSRIEIQGLISTAENSYGVVIRGIEPKSETRVTAVKDRIIKGEYLEESEVRNRGTWRIEGFTDEKRVLIGYRLAERLNADIGDKIVLMVQAADGSITSELFRLKGVFKMGAIEMDSSFVFIPLRDAQMLAALGGNVTEIALMVKRSKDVLPAAGRLEKRLSTLGYEVYTWDELMPALQEMIELDNIFMYIILLIVLAVVSLGILNTLLMAIMERTREFGIMMAMGTKPYQIVLLVIIESFFIGMAGVILGLGIGIGANNIISIKGFDLSRWGGAGELFAILNPVVYPETSPGNVLWSSGIVFLTAIIVSIYPALKAARLKPVEAMHFV